MQGLGNVILGRLSLPNTTFSFDESVCGMIFDYGLFDSPFNGFLLLAQNFSNNQCQLIHSMEEAEGMGLNSDFMNGVPYYHIKKFYDYVGGRADLYLTFANCVSEAGPDFSVIKDMQRNANGKIFQLGIWTEQFLWRAGNDDDYEFTPLLGAIQSQAEALAGGAGRDGGGSLPLSILVNACTTYIEGTGNGKVDYNKLPDALSLDFPKLSVIIGQNGSDEVHTIQDKNHFFTPVGFLGYALACLSLAPAETSLGSVAQFDLNKNDDVLWPELGFGDCVSRNFNSLADINTFRRNILSVKGYILPTTYTAKESGVFFSNDQTLSKKDFATISLNRIAHKCRRIIRSVMLPYINGNISIDPNTGVVSSIEQTKITNLIIERLDANMVNPLGQNQISGRYVTFDDTSNILETDELDVNCYFVPVSSNMTIDIQEAYVLNE